MSWENMHENDFFMPDEDVSAPQKQKQKQKEASATPDSAHNQAQHQAQPQPQSSPKSPPKSPPKSASNFSWTPTVDLASTFAPFTNSGAFPGSSKTRERSFTGGDTLDEPVWDTLKRDLTQIGRRVAVVVWPVQLQKLAQTQQAQFLELAADNGIRLPQSMMGTAPNGTATDIDSSSSSQKVPESTLDWDLWGPLIFSLAYAVTMGVAAPTAQTNVVFSGTFSFSWLFYFVIGLNIQLLGGSISFLSAISATGYSVFPIVVGAILSTLLIKWRFIRLIIMSICTLWSIFAACMSLKCSGVLPGRIFLAMYPVGLMYAVLSWLAVIT